jgi:hypothetical protein
MLNAFDNIPQEARPGHRRAYREFLGKRDGELDLDGRKLSEREKSIARFEGAQPKSALEPQLFQAQYDKFDKRRETSREMLLLLALVKMNGAEAYGVDAGFDFSLRAAQASGDDSELYLLIEEHYHTRILLSSAREFGLNVIETFRPPLNLRALIGTITSLPASWARPLTLASEVYGVSLFASLLGLTRDVFKQRPALRDAIEERIMEVLVDEIGHVTFNRLGLGAWGLYQAEKLVPLVRMGLSDFVPELRMLGVDMNRGLAELNKLPGAVRRSAFVV